uniref:MADS-box protein SVP isoform X1 n=1 Tax=Rhizophora mucronata TaxID=61149 RepID=A0A2P2M537_RHIMU
MRSAPSGARKSN